MERDFRPVQTGPGAHPASCTMGTGSFPGVKYGRVVLLTTHPLLVPGSSVGIATGYGLDGPGIESRWGRDFSPVQSEPGAHPASCTMGTGSSPGVNYGRGVLLTTHPLLVLWSRKSRAITLPTFWATTGPVTGTLYLLFNYRVSGVCYVFFVDRVIFFYIARRIQGSLQNAISHFFYIYFTTYLLPRYSLNFRDRASCI